MKNKKATIKKVLKKETVENETQKNKKVFGTILKEKNNTLRKSTTALENLKQNMNLSRKNNRFGKKLFDNN